MKVEKRRKQEERKREQGEEWKNSDSSGRTFPECHRAGGDLNCASNKMEMRVVEWKMESGIKQREESAVLVLQRCAENPHDSPPRRIIAGGCGCCSIFEFAAIRVPLFTRPHAFLPPPNEK